MLNNSIQEIPGVTSTETMISLEQSISRTIPINITTDEEEAEKIEERLEDLIDEVED